MVQPDREPADSADLALSEACERDGDTLCAIEALARHIARVQAAPGPATPASGHTDAGRGNARASSLQPFNDRLWRLTAALQPAQVDALATSHRLAPLWQLRQAMSGSISVAQQASRLRDWMARWPDHPFVDAPPTNLPQLPQQAARFHRIGLFIPLSGPLATAGRAVRDGFVAAYLDDAGTDKPTVRIYDSAAKPIPALYEQSLVDGTDLIVGPLSRQRLDALSRLRPHVPVLGLNYLHDGHARSAPGDPGAGTPALAGPAAKPAFLHMGLAIEDEAATITDRLLRENLHRLLAVHGSEEWALRGAQALAAAWPHELDVQAFSDVRTITESVGQAMRVADSERRHSELQRLLNTNLEFMPRARTDLDGVVAFVNHVEAAALAPALKFHYADNLPVYASSQSVRAASALDELNGFQVAELPFNLRNDPLWNAVRQAFNGRRGNTAALHALGVDAYRIVNHWEWVAHGEPLYGATGKLQLVEQERMQRTLAWGSITRGRVGATAFDVIARPR